MPVTSSATQSGDPVDGFLYSTTLPLLPVQSRAQALAQMDILRKAGSYKCKMYGAPDTLVQSIPSHGQVETQIRMIPGTYIWGISVDVPVTDSTPDHTASPDQLGALTIQVTEAATELPLFADYIQAMLMSPGIPSLGLYPRAPFFLSPPRLIGPPGQINVEIYNDYTEVVIAQVCLFCAEPIHQNPTIMGESNRRPGYGRTS